MEALVQVRGWVGNTPEVRTTAKGDVIRFRVASTSRYLRGGEWVEAETVWLSINAWRQLARNAAASLRKGDPVLVCGKLRTESWLDKQGELREEKILEATAIGHDLAKGCTMFRRTKYDEYEVKNEPLDPNEEPPTELKAVVDQLNLSNGICEQSDIDQQMDRNCVG
ncbi:MAG: single-stranded DNA-binding protein [Propionibacteriaceae bacterium]